MELLTQDLDQVVGGVCQYGGHTYSEGSDVEMGGGAIKTCREDGTWG